MAPSGGIGTFAVQIAKSYGSEVTGVTGTRNIDLFRSLGAKHIVDYTRTSSVTGGLRPHPRHDRAPVGAGGCISCSTSWAPQTTELQVGVEEVLGRLGVDAVPADSVRRSGS